MHRRPRVFYGWWVVAVGALVSGLGAINSLGFTVFFLPLSQELRLTRATTSLVVATSRVEAGILGPLSGWAIDRLGVRLMLTLGSIIAGTGLILMGTVVHNLWSLFVLYGLVAGLGFSLGFFASVMAAINSWFIRRRTLAMGITNAAWGAFGFILVPILAFLVLHYGWRVAAAVAGVIVAASALPVMLVVRNSPESMGLLPDGVTRDTRRPAGPAGPAAATSDVPVGQALKSTAFWLMVAASTLQTAAYSTTLVHFAPMLVWKGLGQQGAANLIGLWSLSVVPANLIGGYVGDMLDKRRLLSFGMLVGAVAYALLAVTSSQGFIYVFLLLLAVMDYFMILPSSLLGDYFGRRSFATLRGITGGIGAIGSALSPVYAGWVWDRTESYALALIPLAGLFVGSALIYALLPRPRAFPRAAPA